jgi:hypothetical protein
MKTLSRTHLVGGAPLFVLALGLASAACATGEPPTIAGSAGAGSGGSAGGGKGGKQSGGSGASGGSAGSGTTGGSSGSAGTDTGSGGTGNAGSGGNGGVSGMPPVGGELSDCTTPAPRLIRRLTAMQYRNSLVDAFGDANVPAADVLADPASALKFRVDADLPVVRDLDAGLLLNYAETVAAWAVESKLSSLAPCQDPNPGCSGPLIRDLGRKLYREALTSDQVSAYQALFDAESTFQDGAAVVISTMLQSPYALYRRELGAASGDRFALSAEEVASELSYFLTDSAPDSALLDAAEQGRLATQADIDREAARLLETDAAKESLTRFLEGWFELDTLVNKAKDDTVFALTPDMRSSMLGESREFFLEAFYFGGDVAGILSARHTHLNGELATFYQLAGAGSGGGFQKVDLTGTNRAPGLLGQAAFLTSHAQPENSSPVQRGRFVRDRILCEVIPAMPEDLDTSLDSPQGYTTNRQRYETHSDNPLCSGCHVLFDPVGFTFEHYDGFGRYRDQEGGEPVDATGMITDATEQMTTLDGVESLLDYITAGDRARACTVRYWSYYAHGRDNWQDKKCNDDQVRRDADANGYTLKSILMGILHAPSFTRRVQDQ